MRQSAPQRWGSEKAHEAARARRHKRRRGGVADWGADRVRRIRVLMVNAESSEDSLARVI
jgi:hypothetical protein